MAHTHPLLETLFPRRRESLGDQIANLTHDVTSLARHVRRESAPRLQDAAHVAGDFASDVFRQAAPVAREAVHQAKAAGRAVRADPVPAVIALGTFALIAALVLRKQ